MALLTLLRALPSFAVGVVQLSPTLLLSAWRTLQDILDDPVMITTVVERSQILTPLTPDGRPYGQRNYDCILLILDSALAERIPLWTARLQHQSSQEWSIPDFKLKAEPRIDMSLRLVSKDFSRRTMDRMAQQFDGTVHQEYWFDITHNHTNKITALGPVRELTRHVSWACQLRDVDLHLVANLPHVNKIAALADHGRTRPISCMLPALDAPQHAILSAIPDNVLLYSVAGAVANEKGRPVLFQGGAYEDFLWDPELLWQSHIELVAKFSFGLVGSNFDIVCYAVLKQDGNHEIYGKRLEKGSLWW
ncbi:hypothetical protein PMZ80_002188 [Knufia obscura]|uniref:Uncharacterized protein n=1 Tax=Knufia obscura TaxID=1635080 RepID=A0ABR0RWM6_9EURO|nr:hypothetical protein PMZ80_002188 [Knufia obscura]